MPLVMAGERPVLLEEHPSFAAAVDAGAPDYASLVPTQLHRLLGSIPRTSRRWVRCGRCCWVAVPSTRSSRARAHDAGISVVTTYGSAETAGGCVYDGVALDGVRLATEDDGRLLIRGRCCSTATRWTRS